MSDNIEEKLFEIKNAALKDACCNYGYELLNGKTKGDIINRKGVHFIHEDLDNSFKELDVFIAQIDGAFTSWANNQTSLQELEEREELMNYRVSGFAFSGFEENKSVVFSGEKEVTLGTISFKTPKIKLNGNFIYIDELISRLDKVIEEVELYMGGKMAPQYEQSSFEFANENDEDFETAKL